MDSEMDQRTQLLEEAKRLQAAAQAIANATATDTTDATTTGAIPVLEGLRRIREIRKQIEQIRDRLLSGA